MLGGLTPFANAQENNNPPAGFSTLFNGKDLAGWWGETTTDPRSYIDSDKLAERKEKSLADIQQHWTVDNGELVNDGHGLYLTTDKFYGDFELWVDYKTVAKADSGIYLRGVPQVQIWDYTKEGGKWNLGADKGSGGLWNNPKSWPGKDPAVLADKPFGEWNRVHVLMIGDYVTVWLNDKLVVDKAKMHNYYNRKDTEEHGYEPVPMHGPIQLQTHGGEIRWRNVFIREIPTDESNKALRAMAEKDGGFEPVFNGKDFTGLKGPVDNYQVTPEGTLMCKPGKGGTIFTDKEYGDFTATLEFLLPPGGNNGLAIRYPGSGDTAYVGMCELQVLDNTAEKYKGLHPAQFHGSAYSQVAAVRGYQRPVGEWNYQTVTVKGHHITVELNGFIILDTDLDKADPKNMHYPIEKFQGRDRLKGSFGFAGHSDPVQFRNVNIKPLD
ncbi:MAG: DUF1080 domain-containing protein [Phycisphaera sp.]|nr:DUF1080 domain-containing protein [Phycisphaera sp.]